MKVQELRDLIKTADRTLLEKTFVESYKQFSKHQKEEVDLLIASILEGKEKQTDVKQKTVNFEELEKQITVFLKNAYAQNYFAPNRVIPKNQRPKWRFLVKGYIKQLEKVQTESEFYPRMVKLFTDLYHLICEACRYYYFSTDDAFRSIGWSQTELFHILVKKTFAAGYSRENIAALVLAASTGGLSMDSLHIEQQMALLSELNTADVKYMAIEEAKKLVSENIKKQSALKKYDNRRYRLDEAVNNLCDMILITYISLAEPEEGVSYYFEFCQEMDKEIVLYRALELADWMDEEDLWIDIYKYGIVKKIKPREKLVQQYGERSKGKTST
ncbi:hypothetical protein [Muricomes intestini]|uniref:hypothetical protein n=1 Tax=Muricomes intestini TaxID=1796634 RepID=UPI000E8A248F|nr:hypothetical protein [Lachnospiraceae bacterium]HCR83936.1 hypothetical protein [Lachnospiraceae bacterium]